MKCHSGGPRCHKLPVVADGADHPYSLDDIVAAASSKRFAILQQPQNSWFRASALEAELGITRGAIRKHAMDLWARGLLDCRAVEGAPRETFEWRVNASGVNLRRHLKAILEDAPHKGEERDRYPTAVISFSPQSHSAQVQLTLTELEQLVHAARTENASTFWLFDT